MTGADAEVWLAAACEQLSDLPVDRVALGLEAARDQVRFTSEVVPFVRNWVNDNPAGQKMSAGDTKIIPLDNGETLVIHITGRGFKQDYCDALNDRLAQKGHNLVRWRIDATGQMRLVGVRETTPSPEMSQSEIDKLPAHLVKLGVTIGYLKLDVDGWAVRNLEMAS